MARIIFISPYLKGGEDKARLKNRTNYIATREGVELLKSEHGDGPATKKQREYISRLIKSFPQSKELAEYEDYRYSPSKNSATEFIDQVWEQFIASMDERENFLDYVSHRPGVRSDGDHGLWDKDGKVQNLSKTVEEVANHPGIVWTPVVSLRREDAERLGFTDVDSWRHLINSCSAEIARGYKIDPKNLRWYAALHEKEKHVHVHMMVFSSNPKEGYLTKQGIRDIKSAFATHIFEQDLLHTYERKTEYRNALGKSAQARMAELVTSMNSGSAVSERLEYLIGELAEKLSTTKGKKVYGYLPPRVKSVVDEIVDELAKDERVAAAYSLWQDMQNEVIRTYTDDLPERIPLSQQKEFKHVRNMVIRETLKLAEGTVTFEDEDMDDEPESTETVPPPTSGIHRIYEQTERYRRAKKTLYDEDTDLDEKRSAIEMLERLWDEGYTIAAHQLGKAYRDGLGVAADSGDQYARYTLGKVYLAGENAEKDVDTAVEYLKASAEQGNQYAQYTLGKLYLLGLDVPPDREAAVYYLTQSAEQGNRYAQIFLDRLTDIRTPVFFAQSRASALIVHSLTPHFSAAQDSTHMGLHIDRKRRRELQEKRIAMGHKPDDHEDEKMNQTMG